MERKDGSLSRARGVMLTNYYLDVSVMRTSVKEVCMAKREPHTAVSVGTEVRYPNRKPILVDTTRISPAFDHELYLIN
jgi:hypothetical protein